MQKERDINLSIITACYNCSSTLEEAIESIYTQELSNFEVIMIDDGSIDNTTNVMKKLAEKHGEIKLIFHEKNRGGGAARNTGIKKSNGKFIFCLDGDDILPPKMLPQLVSLIEKKDVDGVLFEYAKFFKKNTNLTKDKKILNAKYPTFENFFLPDIGPSTIINFLYTREAYNTVGGYPEEHGFDTQEFGINFLARGLKAVTCPGTYYYHRQNMKKSYFERVYENGEFSINYYLSMEKILAMFSNNTIDFIKNYDVFNKASMLGENLKRGLDDLYKKDPGNFFSAEKQEEHLFVKAANLHNQRQYKEAINVYKEIVKKDENSPLVSFNILRAEGGAIGKPHETLTQAVYKSERGSKLLRRQHSVFMKQGLVGKIKTFIKNAIIKK